ncbi:hypothetical protein IU433_04620 [Nocardia puris]|uniref:DUF5709 domain-containing protein n=2 Tax=Nocardia puris TaxID=208602 RepID=A0A366DWS0_9NOCA|nr:hypothetical protein [Nocardia puris]MBF6209762.1 hypothetical protein [Nocardia puris]MBF6366334.1 hypothetical protein [Nocardia puris]MBF6458327.1 hypothetical protein [Nocardia puris]RBO94502.1 hypothetical protein DFR74_102925 [Nocardia puris]
MPTEHDDEDLLSATESLDPDELRDDGEAVDPPSEWRGADAFGTTAREQRTGEDLDSRLAEEEPDGAPPDALGDPFDDLAEDDADRAHGRYRGQVSGAPEDGDPLFGGQNHRT